jgi:hypothetical protein
MTEDVGKAGIVVGDVAKLRRYPIVILSGVNGLACESVHEVERPVVCVRHQSTSEGNKSSGPGRKQVPRLRSG